MGADQQSAGHRSPNHSMEMFRKLCENFPLETFYCRRFGFKLERIFLCRSTEGEDLVYRTLWTFMEAYCPLQLGNGANGFLFNGQVLNKTEKLKRLDRLFRMRVKRCFGHLKSAASSSIRDGQKNTVLWILSGCEQNDNYLNDA